MKLITILIAGCCLFNTITSPAFAMAELGFGKNAMIGKQAANFTLISVDDQKVSLAQVCAGRKTIIVFWATWCPYCRDALRELSLMRKEIEEKGIVVLFVSVGETKAAVKSYLNKQQYGFDVLLDQNSSVSKAYQISGVPTLFYLDEARTIVAVEHEFHGDYEKNF